jgi:ubiquinone/menaquinone biosynthesis C-methylase UbiE
MLADPGYLATQYRDASNLNARIRLHTRFSTNKYGWTRWVFDRFSVPPVSELLELGCGPGNLWLENLDRIPAGWEITLSDSSLGMVQAAQRNLSSSQRRFRFERIDAQSIPCPDDSVDVVIANHMLYHVPDGEKAFSEIRRVLRPSGRFYASTVGRAHLQELYGLVKRFAPDAAPRDSSPAASFLLESGDEQLTRWFSSITLHRYQDALVVTEAAPLVAYILSSSRSTQIDERVVEFTEFVERELALHGSIYVTKDSGMFEASHGT